MWYSAQPLPLALNMPPSHPAIMKAAASKLVVGYFRHPMNSYRCGLAYLGVFWILEIAGPSVSLSLTSTPGTVLGIYGNAIKFKAPACITTWWLGVMLRTDGVRPVWIVHSRWGVWSGLEGRCGVGFASENP